MNRDFIDIHQHLLWGMDDGAASPQVMEQMLRAAHEQRVHRVFATPHVCPGIRSFDAVLYVQRLEEARRFCRDNALNVEVCPGAEIAWTYAALDALRQGRIPTMNGTAYVLIEFWRDISWREVESAVQKLLCAGFCPIIAHVERYRCFALSPKRAERLKQRYAVNYQVNASAVLKREGTFRRWAANRLLKQRLIDAVASDAHDCTERPQRMAEAWLYLTERFGRDYADALTHFDEVFS